MKTENTLRFLGSPHVAVPLLFVLAFAVRFPAFFTPTIDWDESTFILFGQHILDGGLPYVDYFDIKPPLLFYFFAGAIKLFGATVPAVRTAGVLCVLVAAGACYFLARRMWDGMAGLLAGILCISAMSVGSGAAVLSEAVAMASLMACVYLVIAENRRGWAMFLAGACMGAAVLVRSNLAYPCLFSAPGVLYILLGERRGFLRRALLYVLGGVCVLLLTLYPFYARDALGHLYRAVVLTPLEGLDGAMSVSGLKMLMWTWNDGWNLFMILALCGLFLDIRQCGGRPAGHARHLAFLGLILAATAASFLGGKTLYGHYFVQLIPILALFGGALLSRLLKLGHGLRLLSLALALYILLLPLLPLSFTLQRMGKIVWHMDGGFHVVSSDESETARYIRGHLPEGRTIWVMDNHIIYWLLSMEPPSRYLMHPSKITLPVQVSIDSGRKLTALTEIKETFAKRPYFIVRGSDNRYIREGTLEGSLINAVMDERYEKVAQFGRLGVFRIADEWR
jgi:4-amino-4-deoxy-L-arabinose transferase-like glycosyltransferase